jgi:hypothetical protein
MEPLEFERVTIESLQAAQRGESKGPEGRTEREYSASRAAESSAETCLSEQAESWLLALPEAVRPSSLAASHPRVVNRMCQLWRRPTEMDRYFEDLLTDRRGGRQGFPFNIASEIASLSEHYRREVFPLRRTLWDTDRSQ